jgi:hypothetical protein
MLHPEVFPKLVEFDYRSLRKLVYNARIELEEPGTKMNLPGGAILFSGELGKLESVA